MVFESLIREDNAEKHPWHVFLIGMLYATIGVVFHIWLFKGSIDNLSIFITVFASIPLMYKIIILEEKKAKNTHEERNLLKEHKKALIAFIALFIGICIAFTFWNLVLPQEYGKEIFRSQINDVDSVREIINGRIVDPGNFLALMGNNFRVLLFSFLFSFFFGAGAIFILTWNASILAVVIGAYVRQSISAVSGASGFGIIASFLGSFSYGFFGYMTHGIFEIASYFLAGLAGGVVSVAVIRHDLFNKELKINKNYGRILKDSLWLLLFAILFLILGAFVETFVSPVVF